MKKTALKKYRAELTAIREDGTKVKLIATDGVFSMDGYIANLKGICDLCRHHQDHRETGGIHRSA